MSSSFEELRQANITRQEEWQRGHRLPPLWRSNELAGEVGEVCNVVKKLEREKLGLVGSQSTVDQLKDEIGDVLICLDLLAGTYNIDLDEVWRQKFNKTSNNNGLHTRVRELQTTQN